MVDSSTDAAHSAPLATVSDDDDFEFSDFQAAPTAPVGASAGADVDAPQSIAGPSASSTHADETASLQDASTDPSGAAAASSSTSDSTPDLQPVTVPSLASVPASGVPAPDAAASDGPVAGATPSDGSASPVAIEDDQGAPAPASVSPAPPMDASVSQSPDFEHVEHAHDPVDAAFVVAQPPQPTAAPATAEGPVPAASAVAEEGSEEDFGDFEVGALFIGSPPPHTSGS